jgi:3-hydroxyacyl-CoA dehydrogenase
LFPAWGGAFLIPNLIGAQRAVQLIIENPLNQNKMLTGSQAYELGLADAIFDSADFLARSLDWAGQVVAGSLTVTRPEVDRGESWNEALAEGRRFVDSKVFGAAPAPYRALALMAGARTSDRSEAYAAEDEALADLIMTAELRASLYAFDLVQKRARKPAGAPDATLARPVTKVGIVGAGLMASQLALLFLRRLRLPVVITDLDQERVDKGLGHVAAEIDRLLGKQRISPDEANRLRASISGTTELIDFADCDFVIEAVFEEMLIKKQVFADLEKHVPENCVLASNTSSLSIAQMAADLDHPERVVGFHFFNPVAVLPLVEIVRGPATEEETLATGFAIAKTLKKNAVLVKDAAGFVVNRILLKWMAEIFAAVDEGTPIETADAALRPLGLPMPPSLLLQLVGPAVALHVVENLHAAFGDRYPVSPNLRALVASGRPGIYDWTPDGEPYVSDETAKLFKVGNQSSTAEQIRERALNALAEEIGLMLADGVVAAPMDIDLCLILGAGWPFHLGGITPYLDSEGVSERVLGHRLLPPGVASVPTNADLSEPG